MTTPPDGAQVDVLAAVLALLDLSPDDPDDAVEVAMVSEAARRAARRAALRAVDHPSVSTSGPRMRAPGYEPLALPVWPPFTGPTHTGRTSQAPGPRGRSAPGHP